MSRLEFLLDTVAAFLDSEESRTGKAPEASWNLVTAHHRWLCAVAIDEAVVASFEADRAYQAIEGCLRSFRECVELRSSLEATVEVLHGRRAANVTERRVVRR